MRTTGVKDRLVLAHKDNRDPLCQLSEHSVGGIYMVPDAGVGQSCLRTIQHNPCIIL